MNEFKINEFLTLRLEEEETVIYINGEPFIECMFLMLNIPIENIGAFKNIDSIDEAADILRWTDEGQEGVEYNLSPLTEFWGHCSNLQVWYENGYDTRLLHSNLAFPLLKKLADAGGPLAEKVFNSEIVERFQSGYPSVMEYIIAEGYIPFNREIKVLLTTLEKVNREDNFEGVSKIFDLFYTILRRNGAYRFFENIYKNFFYLDTIFECREDEFKRIYYDTFTRVVGFLSSFGAHSTIPDKFLVMFFDKTDSYHPLIVIYIFERLESKLKPSDITALDKNRVVKGILRIFKMLDVENSSKRLFSKRRFLLNKYFHAIPGDIYVNNLKPYFELLTYCTSMDLIVKFILDIKETDSLVADELFIELRLIDVEKVLSKVLEYNKRPLSFKEIKELTPIPEDELQDYISALGIDNLLRERVSMELTVTVEVESFTFRMYIDVPAEYADSSRDNFSPDRVNWILRNRPDDVIDAVVNSKYIDISTLKDKGFIFTSIDESTAFKKNKNNKDGLWHVPPFLPFEKTSFLSCFKEDRCRIRSVRQEFEMLRDRVGLY